MNSHVRSAASAAVLGAVAFFVLFAFRKDIAGRQGKVSIDGRIVN
jgi:hypothetical protein